MKSKSFILLCCLFALIANNGHSQEKDTIGIDWKTKMGTSGKLVVLPFYSEAFKNNDEYIRLSLLPIYYLVNSNYIFGLIDLDLI